jgi:hypothetical protein
MRRSDDKMAMTKVAMTVSNARVMVMQIGPYMV